LWRSISVVLVQMARKGRFTINDVQFAVYDEETVFRGSVLANPAEVRNSRMNGWDEWDRWDGWDRRDP
jgi:hypothetical protein